MPLLRGMQPFRPDAVRLKFGDYLNRPALPPLPALGLWIKRAFWMSVSMVFGTLAQCIIVSEKNGSK